MTDDGRADDRVVFDTDIVAMHYSVSEIGCVDGLCVLDVVEIETNTACYMTIDSRLPKV
jgi:hypothetical protein